MHISLIFVIVGGFALLLAELRRKGIIKNPHSILNGGKNRFFLANNLHVCSAQFIAVLGIGLRIKRNLLALCKRFIAIRLGCGEMHKYILAAVVVRDEAVAFF